MYAMPSDAAHPNVNLKAYDGTAAGGTVPYSPKQTCSGCHINNCVTPTQDNQRGFCTTQKGDNDPERFKDYEEGITQVAKSHKHTQISGALPTTETSYTVPAPMHGVSVGYHSQQGRNIPWNQAARNAYKLLDFTSSPGMWGKY
jgi:hypothetical protein